MGTSKHRINDKSNGCARNQDERNVTENINILKKVYVYIKFVNHNSFKIFTYFIYSDFLTFQNNINNYLLHSSQSRMVFV